MPNSIDRRRFLCQSAKSTATLFASPIFALFTNGSTRKSALKEWQYYGGDPGSSHYSALDQINRSNVHKLKVAWTYHTGDKMDGGRTTMQCTPIVVDGRMYVTSALIKVSALNAATGEVVWTYDPSELFEGVSGRGVNRGVTYWKDGKDQRILFVAGTNLVALNVQDGKPIPSFGQNGLVDLTKGLDRDITGMFYRVTSPGIIYQDLIILGSYVGEGPRPAAPGHVRAFNVRTGRQEWIFHTIPQPGEVGHDTWEKDSWKTSGGANDWGGMSLDENRGLVFLALGSPSFDFYGGQRLGQNLFGNSVVALEAATGKRVWHFQVVHHDLWDYDLPCAPNLVTLNHNGHRIEAVSQVTKTGRLFLFERETGKPLFPIEERSVPASDMAGEKAWPSQPFPVKPPPFTRQAFTEAEITNISSEAHAYVLEQFKNARSGSIFVPPSKQGTIVFPGFHGGALWGGAAFDPSTGYLYVNSNEVPWIMTLVDAKPSAGYPYDHTGYKRFEDAEGYPATKPPWGKLTAIDLNQGTIIWQVPLGEFRELTARGIPQTGTENIGGSIVTAGGLVFIGATKDNKFRAFDKTTGRVLWETTLDAGAYAVPSTYQAGGKQFVVIAAGGGGKLRTQSGDSFVAFALL